jgi:AmmeMemoRadiSam system protein B
LCGDRVAVAFDASKTVQQLVSEAAEMVRMRKHPIAIFSMGCVSTVQSLLATNRIGTDSRDLPRSPALADTFYPADPAARQGLVATFAKSSKVSPSNNALAIMTPHAGLRYSGQIAMDAWRSASKAETVVIIGPKHTNLGADWAVSPSTAWQLPGGMTFDCDLDLARRIVDHVEGMEFDAAAHLREHNAEVQLPILEELLANSKKKPKLVCIAMASASWSEIEVAARQLADVLRAMDPRPLLVISSDMNHFADDTENRRRDAMALHALEQGDPKELLETCRKHSISMCGVVPAALVMQTLRELHEPYQVEQLSYDTSATASRETHRVVGYAACRWTRTAGKS